MSDQRRREESRRGRRGEQPLEGGIHVDLGFGELFKGLGSFLDLVGSMAADEKPEVARSGEIHGPSGVRGVYGFSVKMGLGGQPTVEHFGNIRPGAAGTAEVSAVREPLVDVFDEGSHVVVVVELPGVAEQDIRAAASGDILTLDAERGDRKYAKEILLPAAVNPSTLRQTYQNGVLEIRLDKAASSSQTSS